MRFEWMRYARLWVTISAVVIAACLVSLLTLGLNVSIDFTGGTLADLKFEQPTDVATVRAAVQSITGREPVVQAIADVPGEFAIRTVHLADEAEREKFFADLQEKLGAFERMSVSEISAAISSELVRDGILAVAIAAVLQVIYLAFRFDLKMGVTAVIALLHDVIVTLGLVSFLRLELGPAFIAAALTVIGFSMNDTIVIFDRIRENLRYRKRGESLAALINQSISQTLARSINTTLTVQFCVLALLIFGGHTTRDFIATLFIGFTAGVYSSVFIASPIWMWWTEAARKAAPKATPPAPKGPEKKKPVKPKVV